AGCVGPSCQSFPGSHAAAPRPHPSTSITPRRIAPCSWRIRAPPNWSIASLSSSLGPLRGWRRHVPLTSPPPLRVPRRPLALIAQPLRLRDCLLHAIGLHHARKARQFPIHDFVSGHLSYSRSSCNSASSKVAHSRIGRPHVLVWQVCFKFLAGF